MWSLPWVTPIGACLAGLTYALGRMVPFAVNATSFLVSALTLRAIGQPFQQDRTAQPARGPRSLLQEIREGLRWRWRNPSIRTLALLDAGDSLRYGAGYLLIIMLAQRLGCHPDRRGDRLHRRRGRRSSGQRTGASPLPPAAALAPG